MKLLVTGANGRLGKELMPLLQNTWQISSPASNLLNITDEGNVASFIELFAPDLVLHMAAYTDVTQAETSRELAWRTNVVGTRNIAKHAPKLVHVSTDYVFDGERGQYTETDAPKPANYYAFTKTVAEESVLAAGGLVVRTSFKVAPWPYPVAFDDQFTGADYSDVIAAEFAMLLSNLDVVWPDDGLLHLVTARKSVFELARQRTPEVKAGSRLNANVHIPPDVSLDISRWQNYKKLILSKTGMIS